MILPLDESHIDGLNALPPLDWDFDYEAFLRDFRQESYFHAFCHVLDGNVVSTGNIFTNDQAAWLANILVDQQYRRKGIGRDITQHLVDFIKAKGVKTQILIAAVLGASVYKKIGFRTVSEYMCFESTVDRAYTPPSNIRQLNDNELTSLLRLDLLTNGEDRIDLIQRYYKEGYGYFTDDHQLLGAYLPRFSRGLVIAKNPVAGRELLTLKHAKKGGRSLLPAQNHIGIEKLESLNLAKGTNLTRMIYGEDINWNPEFIYSYGSGYCG